MELSEARSDLAKAYHTGAGAGPKVLREIHFWGVWVKNVPLLNHGVC